MLALTKDQMEVRWWTGEVHGGRHDQPQLEQVARIGLDVPPPEQAHRVARAELRSRRARGRTGLRVRGGTAR